MTEAVDHTFRLFFSIRDTKDSQSTRRAPNTAQRHQNAAQRRFCTNQKPVTFLEHFQITKCPFVSFLRLIKYLEGFDLKFKFSGTASTNQNTPPSKPEHLWRSNRIFPECSICSNDVSTEDCCRMTDRRPCGIDSHTSFPNRRRQTADVIMTVACKKFNRSFTGMPGV